MGDRKKDESTDEYSFLLHTNQFLHYFLKFFKNHSSKAAMEMVAQRGTNLVPKTVPSSCFLNLSLVSAAGN